MDHHHNGSCCQRVLPAPCWWASTWLEGGPLLVHGEVEGGPLLPGLLLPGQEVHGEVPGDADHPVTLHHVVPGHHQVVAVRQVPAPGSGKEGF